jgi:pimeloyl-ACP methyl ester carboxylesterase
MFACPRGTKEYESVVAVNAKAFAVHTALLAVGAKSGHPVRFQPEYAPATGSRIKIEVQWKAESGNWRSANAKDWVQDGATKAPLNEDWVFAGSGFWKDPDSGKEFYYAEGGELVCVSNFSTATLDLPIESSQRDAQRLYQAFTENVPPLGTRVKLILTPALDAQEPESANGGARQAPSQADQDVLFEPGKQIANAFALSLPDAQIELPYLLFTPKQYAAGEEALPLLLFLHGWGESGRGGEDLRRVKIHGPPMLAERDEHLGFVIISPQCPPTSRELEEIVAAWKEDHLIQLLDHVVDRLRVDRNRVYVTGLSMGGYGTWRIAARYPNRFAAAVPICGGGRDEYAAALKDLPIWCFHGAKDTLVEPRHSQEMIDAIKAAGGSPRLTIYPDVGHNSWVRAYNDPALFEWLRSHSRDKRVEH